MHERALLINESISAQPGPAIASSCFYLAEALAARGDLKPALQCALKGCSIRQVPPLPLHLLLC